MPGPSFDDYGDVDPGLVARSTCGRQRRAALHHRDFGAAEAHGGGPLRLRAAARGAVGREAGRLRPSLLQPQGRGRADRRGDVARRGAAAGLPARRRDRGRGERQAHHLCRALVLPDRDREHGDRRRGRPAGVARKDQGAAGGGGAVHSCAQAAVAVHARDRRGHLAHRSGDRAHPPPARGPLSVPRTGMAGAACGQRIRPASRPVPDRRTGTAISAAAVGVGAAVGGEIGRGRVGLMPDRRDHRDRTCNSRERGPRSPR